MKKCFSVLVGLFIYLAVNAQDSTNRFPKDGNVGIGTMSPGSKLDVIGNGRFNGSDVKSPNPNIAMYSPDAHFLLLGTSFGRENYSLMIQPGDQAIVYSGYGLSTGTLVITPWGDRMDGMRFGPTGDVSIGTIKTGGAKLAVNGTGLFTKVIVKDIVNWPDYVFSESYQLPSLQDVESYIADHKKLPGIPSAEAIAKEGQDIADIQVQQMQKIEELTLYIIQLNKKLEAQEQRLKELEKKRSDRKKELM